MGFVIILCLVFIGSIYADSNNDKNQQNEYLQEEMEEDDDFDDVWFGPGFYYGIWFEQENDYWGWRRNYRHYPSNRQYYHHDHPIHYDHENHQHQGEHGSGHGHK